MSSINHYSPETTLYWTNDQQQQAAMWLSNSHTPRFNLNDEEEEEEDDVIVSDKATNNLTQEEEKVAMFEKPLTPSDVGKLNRLVIPKQHAEKHFPLDSSAAKGLLLSFEDESGKCWRFRYSYWNSSQSYVLTKGWSRYVKDKRLHAGDVVLFHRHRSLPQRFFISCSRRQPNPVPAHVSTTRSSASFYSAHPPYPAHHFPFPYQPHSLHAPGGGSQGQNETTPGGNSSSSGSGRVLRLFGVNMECQPDNHNDSQNSTPECSYTHLYHHQTSSYSSSSNPHHHMVPQQP
ncbi:hypothetical protein AAZX31_03G179000 [Glycine max]|uniref:TF-B3 domain-containing protein n=2 Tax=Glycine subgen. Soja TaxID=1462606 RepID=K7KG32_SOYBN|nr:B3 domain-containing protein At2g36080 [Glycine max]XP_028226071.1 B3 domain-containing protein At2g36080-like [Glycine soja]KAG5043931.1 hypothetical protein JHK87_007846 [Glycine soja]KAG5055728.1 hypothetical protein JHK85_008238 [Glycine max]KAG5072789.1 hypothetical protein JHK86_008000 [Glycine max]KAH1070918.1 hypothetical protein GYH30_007787 [Glycine max]KAH1258831.1 B3 domain-containing protein [Glycine max]|eukprot:XP_006577087.1 B3 domain-containing protein At2g36080 [Glycine max]